MCLRRLGRSCRIGVWRKIFWHPGIGSTVIIKKKKKLQSDFVSKNPSSVKVKIVIQVKYSFTRSLRTVGSLFPSFFFCQEDILYKSKLYKYTSSSAVIEVIVAQKNNWKSRTKNEKTNKQKWPFTSKSSFIDSQHIHTLFVDFIKFSIGSKWHYTD